MPPPYCYEYPRPAVTVDLVAFAMRGEGLRVLLIRRKSDPFAGRWALPGGFLDMDEEVEAAARRELREETGLEVAGVVEPIGAFGAVGRDPRGRTISLAHAAAIRGPLPAVAGGDDAAEAAWLDPRGVTGLAFDHDAILAAALAWLARRVQDGPAGLTLLPREFGEEDAKAMLRAALGSLRGVAGWLPRLERAGLVRRESSAGRYRSADD